MRKYRVQLAVLVGTIALGLWGVSAVAVDTTIKCSCTCRDQVGTWKATCYSTSSCDTCCSFRMSGLPVTGSVKITHPEVTEGATGKLVPITDVKH